VNDRAQTTARTRPPREARWAAEAMLVLAGLTTVMVLVYFFARSGTLTWGALVALATIPFSVVCAVLLWRSPTRENAGAALLVVGFSVVRVGLPGDWTRSSYALLALTLVIAAPVVWAAKKLPP
jgi:hypothetical protein